MSDDDTEIKVDFKFMRSGWRYENRMVKLSELKKLFKDAKVVNIGCGGWIDPRLRELTLRLKDGRKCELSEENNPSYEGSSEGWINIFISEDWSE